MPDTGRADGAGFSIEMRAQGKRKMQQIHSLWWDAAGPMRAFRRLFFFFKKKKKENGKKWLDQLDSLQDAFVAVFRLADARTHEVWPADKVAKSLAQAFGTHHKTRLQVNTRKREKNIKKAPQQEENLGLDAKKKQKKMSAHLLIGCQCQCSGNVAP